MPSSRTAPSLVTSTAMPAVILPAAAGVWTDHRDEISAAAPILVATGLALLIDRALVRRGGAPARVVPHGQGSAGSPTPPRVVRRAPLLRKPRVRGGPPPL